MNELVHHVLAYKSGDTEVVAPDAFIARAVDQMNRQHVGSLLVVDRTGRLVGILTERDLLARVLAERRDPQATLVRDVMTRELTVVGPRDSVVKAMMLVTETRHRHLPVVEDRDDSSTICGVVSGGDLMAWMVREQRQTIDDLYQYITR